MPNLPIKSDVPNIVNLRAAAQKTTQEYFAKEKENIRKAKQYTIGGLENPLQLDPETIEPPLTRQELDKITKEIRQDKVERKAAKSLKEYEEMKRSLGIRSQVDLAKELIGRVGLNHLSKSQSKDKGGLSLHERLRKIILRDDLTIEDLKGKLKRGRTTVMDLLRGMASKRTIAQVIKVFPELAEG